MSVGVARARYLCERRCVLARVWNGWLRHSTLDFRDPSRKPTGKTLVPSTAHVRITPIRKSFIDSDSKTEYSSDYPGLKALALFHWLAVGPLRPAVPRRAITEATTMKQLKTSESSASSVSHSVENVALGYSENLLRMLLELREWRNGMDQAIFALEQLMAGSPGKRRGRPPKWLSQAKIKNVPDSSLDKKKLFTRSSGERMAEAHQKAEDNPMADQR